MFDSDKPIKITNTDNSVAVPKVAAVITCFNSKPAEIQTLLSSITNQVQLVILVNNGGLDLNLIPKNEKYIVIQSPTNLGTAGGYNLGVTRAWDSGASHILLLDQDSDCHADMIRELMTLEQHLISHSQKVAVVGPYYICKSNNEPAPFIQHQGFHIKRIYSDSKDLLSYGEQRQYTPCSYVISSGSLISKNAWDAIGKKNENLFLDFTDIEWGLRAAKLGYTCYGSFNAKMFHLIGDEQLHFLGRKISLHSPIRHYYAFRNCIWLFRQLDIPIGTRFNYLIKLLPKLLVYSVFSNAPLKQIKFMILGIYHGFINKMGIYTP